ncbi:ankyrin repeat-containing domain protein [Aspergillus heterothallicus]
MAAQPAGNGDEDSLPPPPPSYRPPSPAPSYHTVDIRGPPSLGSRESGLGLAGRLRNAFAPRTLKRDPQFLGQQGRATPRASSSLLYRARCAIEENDDASFRRFLESGVDVNIPVRHGSRLLHLASDLGRTQMAIDLLNRHADPMRPDRDGFTPMYLATNKGHAPVVRALIAAGADIYAGEPPPLELAAGHGHYDAAAALLETWDAEHGSSLGRYGLINAADRAAEKGHQNLVQLIYRNGGAKLSGRSALHFEMHNLMLAVENAWPELAECTLARCRADNENILKDIGIEAALVEGAARSGNANIMEQLLHAGCDANAPTVVNGKVTPPLRVAVEGRHTEVVRVLLDHGAKINTYDEVDHNVLHVAMRQNGPGELVILLVNRGANIFALDLYNFAPVQQAWNLWGTEVREAFIAAIRRRYRNR